MKTLAPGSEDHYLQDRTGKPPFRTATIGGTFQAMHLGHRQYLSLALRLADTVHIFLTSDRYASTHKNYPVASFDVRSKEIRSFLVSIGIMNRIIIHELSSSDQLEKFMTTTTALDAALVEPQYLNLFQTFNSIRSQFKMKEFCIVLKPRTKVDGLDISSTALQNP